MTRSRSRIGGALLLAAALAGCLFPSFDGLRGDETSGGTERDGAAATPTATPTVTPTTTPTTLPTVDAGSDAGVDAGPTLPKAVVCQSPSSCSAPATYCCAGMITDDECMPQNADPDGDCAFTNFRNARAMRCDGPEDCNAGETCCFVDDPKLGAFCTAQACGGRVLCHPGGVACPVGSCSGTVLSRYAFCR